jgi:hypothetical protein
MILNQSQYNSSLMVQKYNLLLNRKSDFIGAKVKTVQFEQFELRFFKLIVYQFNFIILPETNFQLMYQQLQLHYQKLNHQKLHFDCQLQTCF